MESMQKKLPLSLLVKSKMVGTPVEGIARRLRTFANLPQRIKHPELWELYLEDDRLSQILQKLLKPTSCGIDVGSHIGSFLSLLLSYSPYGTHVAVEPSVTKSEWLKRKFPSATILQIALSDVPGVFLFEENLDRPGYSRLQGDVVQDHVIRYNVETRRLDDIAVARVDLLKLDVEGGELKALCGGKALIDGWRPSILFECGPVSSITQVERCNLFQFINQDLRYDVFTFGDYLFQKGPLTIEEFRKCGIYPFRAFNYLALPKQVTG